MSLQSTPVKMKLCRTRGCKNEVPKYGENPYCSEKKCINKRKNTTRDGKAKSFADTGGIRRKPAIQEGGGAQY